MAFIATLSACAPKQDSVSVKFHLESNGRDPMSHGLSLTLPTDHCYGIHVSGNHPTLARSNPTAVDICVAGPGSWGMVAGLFEKGSTVELEVPVGADRRFDLFAIPKSDLPSGACSSSITSKLSSDLSTVSLFEPGGAEIDKSKLVLFARGTADIRPGENSVGLEMQTASPSGLPYRCAQAASVTSVSTTLADGTYGPTTAIPIRVTFNQPVTVTGSPRILLNTSPTRYAVFQSVSGASVDFSYTVAATDSSADLNYPSMVALELNGGTITSSGLDADITLPAPAAANSISASAIVIDGIAPTVSISSPTAAFTSNSTLAVSGTCSDPGINVDLLISGSATGSTNTPCAAGTFSTSVALGGMGADGSAITITASQDDTYGNIGSDSESGTIDQTAPSGISISVQGGAALTNQATLTMTLAAAGATQMYVTNTSGCASGGTWEAYNTTKSGWPTATYNGSNTIYVKFRDAATNESGCTSDSITHDNLVSDPTISSFPAITNANVNSVPISGTCVEDGTIEIFLEDSGTNQTSTLTPSCSGGTWSTSINASTMLSGPTVTAYARLTDAAGNQSSWPFLTASKTLTLNVEFVYPTNGNNWNKYVANNGSQFWNASGLTCSSTTGGYKSCLHGGELLKVVVPGQSSCTGITFGDSSGAFDWICEDFGGTQATFFSVGLKPNKKLSDLINFATPAWANNAVTAITTTPTESLFSTPSPWWTNPVLDAPAMGTPLGTAGSDNHKIFTVRSNPTAATGWTIPASLHGVALVVQPGFKATLSGVASVVGFGGTANYTWIEGNFDCNGVGGATKGINVAGTNRFMVIRDVQISRCQKGISIAGADKNSLIKNLRINQSSTSTIANGIYIGTAHYNTFVNVNISGIGVLGVGEGISILNSTNNVFQGLTISATNADGITLDGAEDSVFSNVTIANASGDSFYSQNSAEVIFNNIVLVNSQYIGFHLVNGASSYNFTAANLIATNQQTNGIFLETGVSNVQFKGVLGVGTNGAAHCETADPSGQGLIDGTCTSTGANGSSSYPGENSSAILRPNLNLEYAFVGKATSDAANTIESGGTATFLNIISSFFNWVQFDNPFRAWGKSHGDAGLTSNQRGYCVSGQTCQIWDFSAAPGEDIYNTSGDGQSPNDPFVPGAACPSQVDGSNYVYDYSATVAFLTSASEILDDKVGNDNGLCESNERCLYTPHFGSYQGTGAINQCTFSDAFISNVKMFGFSSL